MARYKDPVCRLCRREGKKLFLKGDRCYSEKCAINRRPTPPGQHGGDRRKKLSEYGVQLREKQKTRRAYGILEKQFEKYFHMAEKQPGIAGENLLILLETRLDNVVFRMGYAGSRAQARQVVRHGHITVNGRRVNIPSYLIKTGDVVAVKEKSASEVELFKVLKEGASRAIPQWLQVDFEKLEGTVIAKPTRDDIDIPIEEHLIVEYYSK